MTWTEAALAAFIPNVGGFAGYFATLNAIPQWYNRVIVKPSWKPTNKQFRLVWPILYPSMGISSYIVWKALDKPSLLKWDDLPTPLKLYALQIGLNWAWTPIFFGAKHLTMGLLGIIALDAAVLATTASFWEIDSTAGLLMVPYVAWLSFSTALNVSIWKNNPKWRWGRPSDDKSL
ncbi:unnamed protein product [Meganyctiphanes norvegica]|uniref:TspO/MBR-related protein n=1 Tax=Meganyctiphanes norvegica TaxID=48144 RepID=A0AAV2S5K1_MEGNR